MSALVSISPVSCSLLAPDPSSDAVMPWFRAVTAPVATDGVPPLPPALPSAVTESPLCTLEESPRLAVVRPDAFCSWITATSLVASYPTTLAV